MNVIKTELPDVFILEPQVFGDHRGWFMESWSEQSMQKANLTYHFLQDNHAFSSQKGTLRGLHFQKGGAAQAKLVRCSRGAVLDVAVDLRCDSPTYKKWVAVELSAENYRQLLVPRGFAHGYLTLTENAEFLYKVDAPYAPEMDGGIRWDDPDIGVKWEITNPILAEKDKALPFLRDCGIVFKKENAD